MTISVDEKKALWSTEECAEQLGISKRTLFTITHPRGTLKSVKIGTRVCYRPESVQAWLDEQEAKMESEA